MSEINYIIVKNLVIGRKIYMGALDSRLLKRKHKRARDAIAWANRVNDRCLRMYASSVDEE